MSKICKTSLLACLILGSLSHCEHGAGPFVPVSPVRFPEIPLLPDFDIALWSAGTFTGDFGLSRCGAVFQSTGGTSDGERIGEWLRQGGFVRAVTFVSTSEYDLIRIHRDPDGLPGLNGPDIRNAEFGTVAIDSSGDFVTQAEFTGGDTTGPILLSDIERISNIGGAYFFDERKLQSVFFSVGVMDYERTPDDPYIGPGEAFWTFGFREDAYGPNGSCSSATNGTAGPSATVQGRYSRYEATTGVGASQRHAVASTGRCDIKFHLLCIARR